MSTFADTLTRLGDELAEVVKAAFDEGVLRVASDDDVVVALAAAGRLLRGVEAALIDATVQVRERSDGVPHADRLTTRYGCRSAAELLQRATRVSKRTAADIVSAAHAVEQHIAPSSGERLPADLPAMREALVAGEVGVDGVVAVAGPLRGCIAGREAMLAADAELAASARGEGADGAPPACADDLRIYAAVWAAFLDQDGAEPREAKAMRKRGLTLGVNRDGLVPVRGNLMPEVAAQLQRGFDALLNPKVDGVPFTGPRFEEQGDDRDEPLVATADDRTRTQKQHDALAIMLTKAAESAARPTLGGAAPTLVVSVRQADLASGRGSAFLSGLDDPVSLSAARHIACSGAVQRVVVGENDRIVSIHTQERVFNRRQRRAIGLRDGGCVIPGCHVPFEWCELHHVVEHSQGGATHTDNGVPLCWWHHRTLDTSGWRIRMRRGVPEVRGPSWWDPHLRWRPVTSSPTSLLDRLASRG